MAADEVADEEAAALGPAPSDEEWWSSLRDDEERAGRKGRSS